MAIRLHILLCCWLLAASTPVIYTAKNIILTPTSPQLTLQHNSSEPSCDSTPCSCSVYVYSPQGTILKTTFLDLQIPSDDEITFINTNNSEELLKLSSIYSVIEPIYLDSSQMSITFDRCGDSSSYSYIEAEFSFLDQLQDSHVRSSGGAFALSGAYPSVTLQTANLSSLINLQAQMHWFITTNSAIWIKVDILEMEPGNENQVCIFDTHNTYGEWVCMTDSVSTTTWYSYDDELRMAFYVSHPGIGFTVKLTLVDHSTWNGQSLTLPACNPTVILQETQTIRFVTPFFNQSLENVKFQCRMDFTSRDLSQPASVEYKHFHFPGEVAVYSVDSQGLVNLADATDTQVTILNDSPIVSISPTHEIYVDVNKHVYSGDGSGVMVQPFNFADRGLEPLESFGVAMKLNDTLSAKAFTTLGYPTLPKGEINIRWLFDKVIPGSAIKVEFVDFDIGTATLFVHVDESLTPIRQLTGSTLPDNIYSDTQRLTLLLRSDRIPYCKRGIHFNVTVIMLLNECTNSPCSNGGTCIDEWESFRCTCPVPYYGDLCQDVITTVVSTTQVSTKSPTSHESSVTSTITTESASTPDKTDVPTHETSPRETSPSLSPPQSSTTPLTEPAHSTMRTTTKPTGSTLRTTTVLSEPGNANDVLIIALSISLTIAFALIAFLVCVVVYRSGKQARTNPPFCSTNNLIPNDSSTRYQEEPRSNVHHEYMSPDSRGASGFTHPLPPTPPPDYETIKPVREGGAEGNNYLPLDKSTMKEGDYVHLNGNVRYSNGMSAQGVHQNPPAYTTDETPDAHDYFHVIQVSPTRARDSEFDYVEPNSTPMNGTWTHPPDYESNIVQTTTFHK